MSPDSPSLLDPHNDLTFLWSEAKEIFAASHTDVLLQDTTTLSQTLSSLKNAKTRAEKAYTPKKITLGGRSIEIKLDRIMNRLQVFLDIGDLAIKAGPETVSLVWSAFRMVFSIFLSDIELCDFLIEAVDEISDVLFICEVHGVRHLKRNGILNEVEVLSDKVLDKIPPIYALVLEFSYAVRDHIGRRKFVRTVAGWFKGLKKELEGTLTSIKQKRDELHRTADVAFKQAVLEVLQDVRGNSKSLDDIKTFIESTLMSEVDEIGKDIKTMQVRSEKKESEKEYERQLKWLRAGTAAYPERQKNEALKRRQSGTCQWIFKEEDYTNWHDAKGLLWVSAEPGFGKSIMVASIVEALENEVLGASTPGNSGKALLVYFFCKTGSDDTQVGRNILLHLLYQLYEKAAKELKIRDRCIEAFSIVVNDRKSKAETASDLSLKEVQNWFATIVEMFERRLYVVVDGLDECYDWKDGFLDVLQQLGRLEEDVHVLVASRPENNIEDAMKDATIKKIAITKEKTDLDIQRYVFGELNKIKRLRTDEKKMAFSVIKEKADGMFRYANLAIDSLQQVKALRTPFKTFMREFPDAMEGFYKQKLQELDPELRGLLLLALRWQVCGGGNITARQVAEDFQHYYVNEEDMYGTAEELENASHFADNVNDGGVAGDDDLWAQLSEEAEKDQEKAEGEEDGDGGDAIPTHETVDDDALRLQDSIDRLKSVSGEFIAIRAGDVLDLRHKSVQDFILNDAEHLELMHRNTLCPQCAEQMRTSSTFEAAPKHGHLLLALTIFKHLNSPVFQQKFLFVNGYDAEISKEDGQSESDENDDEPNSTSKESDDEDDEKGDDDSDSDNDSDYSHDTDGTSSSEEDSDEEEESDDDEEGAAPLRYELTHWHYHLREAEKAWPEEERGEEWDELWHQVENFVSEDSLAHKCWQKHVHKENDFKAGFDHPIHTASRYVIYTLLKRQLEEPGIDVNILDELQRTPLHLACTYTDTYGRDRLQCIQLLVEAGADLTLKDCDEETPLCTLVKYDGVVEAVKLLLEEHSDPTIPDKSKRTCLHYAAGNNRLDLCKMLLEHGSAVNAEDNDGETPLHWLLHNTSASVELVQLLIANGADVNAQDRQSQAPLYEACTTANTEVARILLEHGADVNDGEDLFGATAVIGATEKRDLELVKLLVEKGADIQLRDKQGRDPLAAASLNGSKEIVQFILDTLKVQGVGMDYLKTTDLQRQTPLHRSAAKGHKEVVELLLNASDDPAGLCHAVNQKLTTPLHSAARRGRNEVVKLLVNAGADPLARDQDDMTPFAVAEDEWTVCVDEDAVAFEDTVKYLMDFESVDSIKKTDIFITAVERASVEMCEKLLKLEVDPREEDVHGWSSVVRALHFQQESIVSLLRPYDHDGLEEKFLVGEPEVKIGLPPTRWQNDDGDDEEDEKEKEDDEKKDEKRKNEEGEEDGEEKGKVEEEEKNEEEENDDTVKFSEDGLELHSTIEDFADITSVITDHPVPAGNGIFYWELAITESEEDYPVVGVGFSNPFARLEEMPGFCSEYGPTWGYHGDDGLKYTYQDLSEEGEEFGPLYGKGDTVGCGLDAGKGTIFFTKNGSFIGTAFEDVRRRLYPVVGLGPKVKVRANFGRDPEKPFLYKLDDYADDCVKAID